VNLTQAQALSLSNNNTGASDATCATDATDANTTGANNAIYANNAICASDASDAISTYANRPFRPRPPARIRQWHARPMRPGKLPLLLPYSSH
jgi:hypothetical protein